MNHYLLLAEVVQGRCFWALNEIHTLRKRDILIMMAHVYCTDDEYNGDLFSLHVFPAKMFLNFTLISNDNDLPINIYLYV